jgi:hypothetical protein
MQMEKENQNSNFNDFNIFNKEYNKKWEGLFALQNKKYYYPAILMLKYCWAGLIIRPTIFQQGNVYLDTRFSSTIAIRSGNGKKALIEVIEKLSESMNSMKIMKITLSYIKSLHEEQLVGKTIISEMEGKEPKIEFNRGYFDDDILIRDDALPLLNEQKYAVSRDYIVTVLDPYKKNTVSKRQTGHTRKQTLSYTPLCIILLFVQDKNIMKENVDTGLYRKMKFLYIEAPEPREEDYLKRLKNCENPDYTLFIKIAKNIKNADNDIKITLSEELHQTLAKESNRLKELIKGVSQEFASYMQWCLQDDILRKAVVLSITYQASKNALNKGEEINITEDALLIATQEYEIIINSTLQHWENYVFSLNLKLTRPEQIICSELKKRKAITEEQAIVGTQNFVKELSRSHNISESSFNNAIRKLKDKGLNKTIIIGKGEKEKPNSKIWLSNR